MNDETNNEEIKKEDDSAMADETEPEVKVEESAATPDESKAEAQEAGNPEASREGKAVESLEEPVQEEAPKEEKAVADAAHKKKKGVPFWAAIVVIIACVGVLAMVLRQNGSLIMDPEDWGIGGRRSYIYVQLKSASQADKSANFTFAVPDSINGVSNKEYWIVKDYIYDVRYTDDDGTVEYILHKCERNDLETADTNTYRQSNIVDVDGIEVTEKGQDDLVQSATWSAHGYYYQILTRDDNMLDVDTIAALIGQIG